MQLVQQTAVGNKELGKWRARSVRSAEPHRRRFRKIQRQHVVWSGGERLASVVVVPFVPVVPVPVVPSSSCCLCCCSLGGGERCLFVRVCVVSEGNLSIVLWRASALWALSSTGLPYRTVARKRIRRSATSVGPTGPTKCAMRKGRSGAACCSLPHDSARSS